MSFESGIILETIDILRSATDELLRIPDYSFRAVVENSGRYYRVIAECDTKEFFDSFNGIEISSTSFDISSSDVIHGVELSCTTPEPHQFFMIAIDLLNYIEENGPQSNITKWCECWKLLVGNKYTNNRVYDVLAELLVFSYLQSFEMNPVWSGPDHERHDFRCSNVDCEVKSTVARSIEPIITIQGNGQLDNDNAGNKPIKLFVCQLESSANGDITVKKLLNDLIDKGVDKSELRIQYRKTGLNSSRDETLAFNLIRPIKVYDIDSNFPKIDKNSFKGNQYPEGVINVSYTVSLANVKHKEISVTIENGEFKFEEVNPSENQERS